jgi:hypothetical protein
MAFGRMVNFRGRTAGYRTLVGLLLVGCASLLAPPASGQETVDLRLRLGRGEVVYHARSAEVNVSLQVSAPGAAPVRTSTTARVEGRGATRGLDVDQAGTMLIEWVLEEARITVEGRTEEPVSEPVLLRVRPDGKVVEWLIKPAVFEGVEDFPSVLPGRPVRVGESWTSQTRTRQGGVTAQLTVTTTLTGVEAQAGGRVARLRSRLDGTLVDLPIPPPPPGFQWRTSTSVRGTEETEWHVEQGRALNDRIEFTMEFRLELIGEGRAAQSSGTITLTQQDRLLTGTSVAGSPPPPDQLVAPGKGIGPFTLDLTLADLSSRLGTASEPSPPDVFNASRVSWQPAGLIAYVDPADPGKVVGLEVADRRYRTEKGIGFGSSRGAVLLAYGMSPVIVDLTIPNLGGVSVLVYNDQGIAFSMTADAEHARRGSAHAPIGALDWLTVFPPGSAGKIFKLP